MTKHFLQIIIFMSICISASSQKSTLTLGGKWINPSDSMVIDFYEKNGKWHAKIISIKDSLDKYGEAKRDIYNNDAALRSRKIIGIDFLSELKAKGQQNKWTGGNIYNYENGNTYNAIMNIDESGDLHIKGYWMYFRFLGSTTVWKKVKE